MTRNHRLALIMMFLAMAILFLPWLGLSPFNTKGEPREAIVAVSMLQSGNWILPVSFGADIPYKPPFLAWCIAAISLPWGEVSEYTSRLPSAIAVICLGMLTISFVARRRGIAIGCVVGAVMVTSIEVWRAGFACRVDMLLTLFIVGAMMRLYAWRQQRYRGVPWMALLFMTLGVLTKGPVGMLLPCLVAGLYGLLRGDRFLPLFLRMVACGVVSLIVPALWYVAAWKQGGDEFLQLVMEENFGRMTGTMSYSSHEYGLWYNFVTVILGMLPYTIIAIMALCLVRRRSLKVSPRELWQRVRKMDDFSAFCMWATLIVFVFYCIPSSKRSVYLLPIYPFLSLYIVDMGRRLMDRRPNLVRLYASLIAIVSILVSVAVIVIKIMPAGTLPDLLPALMPGNVGVCVAVVSLIGSISLSWGLWSRRTGWCSVVALGLTMLTLCTVSAAVLPGIARLKTDRTAAEYIGHLVPEGEPIYSYIDFPMLRYYTINYYLADRLRLFEKEEPGSCYMVICADDLEGWQKRYGRGRRVTVLYEQPTKSCDRHRPAMLVRVE